MPARDKLTLARADDFADVMAHLHAKLQTPLTAAQARYYDATPGQPSRNFQVGDYVWLDTRDVATERPAKKLDNKAAGPFKVLEVVNPRSYRLELPQSVKIHPVQNVSKLHRVHDDPLPGQQNPAPPPVEIESPYGQEHDDEPHWEVKEVVASRLKGRWKVLEYKVWYKGFEPEWRSPKDLEGTADYAIADFHYLHPDEPGPLPEFVRPEDWSPEDIEQGPATPEAAERALAAQRLVLPVKERNPLVADSAVTNSLGDNESNPSLTGADWCRSVRPRRGQRGTGTTPAAETRQSTGRRASGRNEARKVPIRRPLPRRGKL